MKNKKNINIFSKNLPSFIAWVLIPASIACLHSKMSRIYFTFSKYYCFFFVKNRTTSVSAAIDRAHYYVRNRHLVEVDQDE